MSATQAGSTSSGNLCHLLVRRARRVAMSKSVAPVAMWLLSAVPRVGIAFGGGRGEPERNTVNPAHDGGPPGWSSIVVADRSVRPSCGARLALIECRTLGCQPGYIRIEILRPFQGQVGQRNNADYQVRAVAN